MRSRTLAAFVLAGTLALAAAAPASAHQAGPCTPSGSDPGHSEFAQHHIVPLAQEGALGAGGHLSGTHMGFGGCNPSENRP